MIGVGQRLGGRFDPCPLGPAAGTAVRPGVVTRDHARSDTGCTTGRQETVGTPFAGGAAGVAAYSLTAPSASSVSYVGPK